MRAAWAVVAGILGAGVLAWWLAREPSSEPAASAATASSRDARAPQSPAPVLYRWRDEAGIVQVTDIPPKDREYTVVDVAALERRNLIDPDPLPATAP